MSVVLCDLFSVTPHVSLCAIKRKRKKYLYDFDFSQPQSSKNGLWDKQVVSV